MTTQLVRVLLGSLVLWLLAAVPAWLLGGTTALADTALACGLCLVPMVATFIWAEWACAQAADQQLLAVLGGTGVRLFVVAGAGIGLYHAVAELHRPAFLLWVIIFYLATLTLEVVVVVRRQGAVTATQHQPSPPSGL